LRRRRCLASFDGGQGASSLDMRLRGFGDEQDRNAFDDPIAVTGGTEKPIRFLAKILLIPWTNHEFQEVFVE
jgi:hypothetical protein